MTDKESVVAVLGAGTMGQGIAVTLARGGCNVRLVDRDSSQLARAADMVRDFFAESVRRGKMTEADSTSALRRIEHVANLADIAGAEFVVEALPENLALKTEVLARVEEICAADTRIHTNTSTLLIGSIADGLARPENLVGTHYCNPAPLMPLVEVARGPKTSDDTVASAAALLESVGKTPVILRDSPGLITNFLVVAFENDSIRALESGLATVEEIDRAVTAGMGFPIGPFRLLDLVGLDVHLAVTSSLRRQLGDDRYRAPDTVVRMINEGRLGRKTGRGFYTYSKEQA
ncbi:3-hydroxyacyl-CoA dehydrogenase family protein [Nocardia sp. CA-129566]|uniref:3-hydroxyacyl-CoA dehydrogenase family protein n=1 Tax=Nocardia sp. CA-129566 TaxID=3239976 RepID=UPI003D96DB80